MNTLITDTLKASADLKYRCADELTADIARAAELLKAAYASGRKSVIFGNGGSASDAQHYAAELVGRFKADRPAMPAIALTVDTSALTSIGNDYGFDAVFARQVEAFINPGDVAIGISTSGNSPNVLRGLKRARELGAGTIGLAGRDGGQMRDASDVCIVVPHQDTARIQEVHICILHIWCDIIERP